MSEERTDVDGGEVETRAASAALDSKEEALRLREADLERRLADLDKREAELTRREAALTACEAAQKAAERTKQAEVEAPSGPEEPVARVEEPVARVEEPVARVEAPVARVEEPVARVEEPVARVEEPVARVEEPVARVEEPVARVEEPVASVEEPGAEALSEESEVDEPEPEELGPKPPIVLMIDPKEASTKGGTFVVITGAYFEEGCVLLLDDVVVPSACIGPGCIETAFAVHDAGEAKLTVRNPSGLLSPLSQTIRFVEPPAPPPPPPAIDPPALLKIEPSEGPLRGGTRVVFSGEHFPEGVRAFFSNLEVAVTRRSAEEIEVVSPHVERDGSVDVSVVDGVGRSSLLTRAFSYVRPAAEPVVIELRPARGSVAGGVKVAIIGDHFAERARVRFGAIDADSGFKTSRELWAVAPASPHAGPVEVAVENVDGGFGKAEEAFVYEALPLPTIAGITPAFGPTIGGTKVVIEGEHFSADAVVMFNRERATITTRNDVSLTCVAPACKAAGVVDVEVQTAAGKVIRKNGFRYDATPAPLITSVSPNRVGAAGGAELTIEGKNFLPESKVLIDGRPPRSQKLVDKQTIEVKVPPGDDGKLVDVAVKNPDGKEAIAKRAFTYDARYR
jgi:hypothetical protein